VRNAIFTLGVLLLLGAAAARAQEDFYRVYQYETPLKGWLEPTAWTTYVDRSDLATSEGEPREGLWAHSAELEYGVTDHLSLAGYADFEAPGGSGAEYTRARVEARYHFATAYEHFFDTAVYAEYYFPRSLKNDTQELETRLILQKDLEDFRLDVNPVVSFPIRGADSGKNPDASLDVGFYWRRYLAAQPGIEWYGDFGEIGKWTDKRQVVFSTVDLRPTRNLVWQLGVGFGLTHDSDKLIAKSILYYEFDLVPPTRAFR
jgi:hypothetical protein